MGCLDGWSGRKATPTQQAVEGSSFFALARDKEVLSLGELRFKQNGIWFLGRHAVLLNWHRCGYDCLTLGGNMSAEKTIPMYVLVFACEKCREPVLAYLRDAKARTQKEVIAHAVPLHCHACDHHYTAVGSENLDVLLGVWNYST